MTERETDAASVRQLDLRLARLHLRGGLVALARAELEAAAGLAILDTDGLAELAEARWRTGDLVGAGAAAEAHLANGGTALVALVIAAEARFAAGRRADAAAAAAAAVEAAGRLGEAGAAARLRTVVAGLPVSPLWEEVLGGSAVPAAPRGVPGDSGSAAPGGGLGIAASQPTDWLAIGTEAAAAGRLEVALAALGLALRREPADASRILSVLDRLEGPGVDLLRGDALRVLGRSAEAEEAYRAAEAGLRQPGAG